MRPESLRCPTCGSQSVQDRTTGTSVSWLVRQDAGSRALLSWLLIATAVLLFAVGAFLAFLGITGGAGVFVMLFFVFWGLLIARFGLIALQTGLEGRTTEPTELACPRCQTTWQVGTAPMHAAPDTSASGTTPSPAPAGAPPVVVTPLPPSVSGVVAPGIDGLEAFIRSSVPDSPEAAIDDAALERQRIDAVRSIQRIGTTERAAGRDGRAAVEALIRLLDVGTGFLPELQIGAAKKTMRHQVIEALGHFGDPAAVEPLVTVLTAELQAYESLATHASDEAHGRGLRRVAMAEDQFEAAADALGALGDPRALTALHEVEGQAHFGMKRAVKAAIRQIESHRAA